MRKYNPAEEKEILALLAQGNQFAFTILFDHYRNGIYHVAFKFLKSKQPAEEIVQEVFTKVWTKRKQLVDILNFEGYLFRMTRNLIFDYLKEIAKDRMKIKEFIINIENAVPADHALIEEQYNELLHEAVSQLPPQQKQIYRLARIEGLSHEAIAAQLQISKLTVKTHMARALQSIRQNLQQHIITISSLPVVLTIITL